MSLVSVYDALKAAGVNDDKAVAAVRDLEAGQHDSKIDQVQIKIEQLEKRVIRLEVSAAIIIALQVGQIFLIFRLLAS